MQSPLCGFVPLCELISVPAEEPALSAVQRAEPGESCVSPCLTRVYLHLLVRRKDLCIVKISLDDQSWRLYDNDTTIGP